MRELRVWNEFVYFELIRIFIVKNDQGMKNVA